MSASEINNTAQSVQQAPTAPPPPQPESKARVVRGEDIQRELEANSPRTQTQPPAAEPYKGDAIDVYA